MNLRNHSTNRALEFFVAMMGFPVMFWGICVGGDYRISLLMCIFILVWVTGTFRAIHEGLHLIAAYWHGVDARSIRADRNNVYIDDVAKNIWIRVALYPLCLPLLVSSVILPFDVVASFAVFLLLLSTCVSDITGVIAVLKTNGFRVTDNESGLFLH